MKLKGDSWMQIPFSHHKESKVFSESLQKFIAIENKKRMSAFLSTENMYVLHHGNTFSSTVNDESDLSKHSVDIEFEYADVRLYKIEQFYQFLNTIIEQMCSQMTRTLYQTISDTCDKTGNVINNVQNTMSNPEAFLEMLKKIEFNVDKNGNILMPSIHLHPSQAKKFMDEIKAQGEEYSNLIEEIKKEKSEQAIQKENERLLKFAGISFE